MKTRDTVLPIVGELNEHTAPRLVDRWRVELLARADDPERAADLLGPADRPQTDIRREARIEAGCKRVTR